MKLSKIKDILKEFAHEYRGIHSSFLKGEMTAIEFFENEDELADDYQSAIANEIIFTNPDAEKEVI